MFIFDSSPFNFVRPVQELEGWAVHIGLGSCTMTSPYECAFVFFIAFQLRSVKKKGKNEKNKKKKKRFSVVCRCWAVGLLDCWLVPSQNAFIMYQRPRCYFLFIRYFSLSDFIPSILFHGCCYFCCSVGVGVLLFCLCPRFGELRILGSAQFDGHYGFVSCTPDIVHYFCIWYWMESAFCSRLRLRCVLWTVREGRGDGGAPAKPAPEWFSHPPQVMTSGGSVCVAQRFIVHNGSTRGRHCHISYMAITWHIQASRAPARSLQATLKLLFFSFFFRRSCLAWDPSPRWVGLGVGCGWWWGGWWCEHEPTAELCYLIMRRKSAGVLGAMKTNENIPTTQLNEGRTMDRGGDGTMRRLGGEVWTTNRSTHNSYDWLSFICCSYNSHIIFFLLRLLFHRFDWW